MDLLTALLKRITMRSPYGGMSRDQWGIGRPIHTRYWGNIGKATFSQMARFQSGLENFSLGAYQRGPQLARTGVTGETTLISLLQVFPPVFLTQRFAVDGSTGCTS
jgi:hypothetical protein